MGFKIKNWSHLERDETVERKRGEEKREEEEEEKKKRREEERRRSKAKKVTATGATSTSLVKTLDGE